MCSINLPIIIYIQQKSVTESQPQQDTDIYPEEATIG